MKAVDALKKVLNGGRLIGFEAMCERDQFIKLCQTLKEEKGYVATVASITLTKLYTGKIR